VKAAVAIIAVAAFTLLFPYQLPISGTAYVTTLINGITTMTSIVVAFGGVMFGAFIFHDEFKNDPKARSEYFEYLGFFIIPPMYLWISYWLLAWEQYDFAIRMSLCGFFVALLIFIGFYALNSKRLRLEKEKKTEPDKPKPDENKTTSMNIPKLTYGLVGKVLICALLIFLVGTLLSMAIVNVFDIHVDLLNPPLPIKSQFMNVDYFVSNTGNLVLPSFGNGAANALLIHIELNLTTRGAFVEDQIVTIGAQGSVSDSFAYNLFIRGEYKPIYVLFVGANNVIGNLKLRSIYGDIFGVVGLEPTYSNVPAWAIGSLHLEGDNQTQIEWSSQGDYYPILLIPTSGDPLLIPYPNKIIHINSAEVLANGRYNRINEVLTVALTAFAAIEIGKLMHESFFKKKN
jgi:hypothetical protein